MVTVYLGILVLVALERCIELRLSHRHTERALAAGGMEYGQRHFVFMKVLHTAFLIGCAAEVVVLQRPFDGVWFGSMLALAMAAQVLRYVAIHTLGEAWNVRVLVVPGRPAVRRGIYRWLRHPNYVAVVLEGFALPLMHGAWITATAFTVLNAALLWVRIRCEEQALERHCDYAPRFAATRRFLPVGPSTSGSTHVA